VRGADIVSTSNDAASNAGAGSVAQIHLAEPAGERVFGAQLSIGGHRADAAVPGVPDGVALQVERRDATWSVRTVGDAHARFNGRPFAGSRDLRSGDVLAVGDAQIVATTPTRSVLKLTILHLVGNQTVEPAATILDPSIEGDDDLTITPVRFESSPALPLHRPVAEWRTLLSVLRRIRWTRWHTTAVIVAGLLVYLFTFHAIRIDANPPDAQIRATDTLLAFHIGQKIFVRTGSHVLSAEREGYFPARVTVTTSGSSAVEVTARFSLAKRPGRLNVDTGGVTALVSVDGVALGRAPGEIEVPAGRRTLMVSAPRYLDYVANVDVAGAGVRQPLLVHLRPGWGTLEIAAVPTGAILSVDGRESGATPTRVPIDAGLRTITLSAPGSKSWQSSIVVRAGDTLRVGPITLGQPDAQLSVGSVPAGAEVSVAGTFRGHTPLSLEVPSGIAHEIVVMLPGYASWIRSVLAEPGKRFALDARLEPILFDVQLQGAPDDAQILIDDEPMGQTPRTLRLLAIEHRVELRKAGFVSFLTSVAPAAGLARSVQYRLVRIDQSNVLNESLTTISAKNGSLLRLVPPGRFLMGSAPRDPGRRANEGRRLVQLQRPFYIGVAEITNVQFRKFHPEHTSGRVRGADLSLDLDAQPVAHISWAEAAAYCNWLSEQEGLPPAYERRSATYALRVPVSTGYRLPTEAEWEYAARYAGPGRTQDYAWGDSPSISGQIGNIAGAEATGVLPSVLTSYRDDYPAAAPIGRFAPNALGLYDMSGNVSEWVNDYYLEGVDGASVADPLGPQSGRRHVVRGANWRTASLAELRLARRDGAEGASETIGFRLARYAK
jgi:formylglycine-generating enzyme required for sulfatase activity